MQRCRQVCMKGYILLLSVPAGAASQHCAWPHHSQPATPKVRQGEGSSQNQLPRGSFFLFFSTLNYIDYLGSVKFGVFFYGVLFYRFIFIISTYVFVCHVCEGA